MKTKSTLIVLISISILLSTGLQTNAQIAQQPEGVLWEIFNNKTTYDFNTLRNSDSIPDQIIYLDSLLTLNNSTLMDFFASRIKGYLIPPVSGEYTFYFACDNTGQFLLSPDTSSADAQLKSEIFSIQNDWTQNTSSQQLIAGQKYFFEILHYDTAYIDMVKLGWTLPGDTMIRVLKTPFISNCGTNVPAQNLSFLNSDITGYPGSEHPIICRLTPWNVSIKSINWLSTNENLATVDESGIVTLVSEGSCQIIGRMADNENVADTLTINVWNYPGPFFVKPGAAKNSNGQNWVSAIDLQTLLKVLNTRIESQVITVYASSGLYKPTETIDRNISFSIKNIRLVGGFSAISTGTDTTNRNIIANETILSGEIGIPNETIDNSYHVVTATKSVIIDGLTISDGRASSYSYGQVQGYYNIHNDNRGGGLSIPGIKSDIRINNCKITNNSAWDRGGGIYCHSVSNTINNSSSVTIRNSEFYGNVMEQEVITTGGIFVLIVNCSGGAIAAKCSRLNISGCKFYNNTARGYGNAIYIHLGAEAIIKNCSFFDNPGNLEDLYVKDGGIIKMNNSTIDGSLSAFSANLEMSNSTITGGGYFYALHQNRFMKLDNMIWPGGWIAHEDEEIGEINVIYSIFKNRLYGNNYQTVIADSVLPYTTWLDSLAYNGGPTPTMKLKNIPGNFALNYGNPLYLDSTDQRGAIRTGSVSIGAYQWVDATEILISPHQLTLTQGDSTDFEVYFLPAFSSNGTYSVSSSDPSIALVDSTRLYGILPGFVNIIAQSSDGTMRDTLICEVIASAGMEEINPNNLFTVYPNPVANELTLKAMGISGNIRYEILNMFGQVVSKGSFTEHTLINTSGLRPGAYLIQCTTDKTVELLKIIKQ